MNTKLLRNTILLNLIIAYTHIMAITIDNPTMLSIAIQFPKILKKTPDVYACKSGIRISPDCDKNGNTISFNFLESRDQTHFWLLIIPEVPEFKMVSSGTVDYLRIEPTQNYKFYSLSLELKTTPSRSNRVQQPDYTWTINECEIPDKNGRLPEETLIIVYNPDFVDHLAGGSSTELPTIVIRNDILVLNGTEDQFYEKSIEILLSSIDYNAIHAAIEKEVRYDLNSKTIRTITT